ncbi:hypothetical protein [Silvimonas sp.]|uniref:hypothetical protein n=1 Tax=Silvimonas sp. TaxID=2650811 RepID=UPI0028436E1F|nr:hypothetical protein [Silvimonas sp.]MDR3426636.1 hypothetical protein [Silvimonas sp.]
MIHLALFGAHGCATVLSPCSGVFVHPPDHPFCRNANNRLIFIGKQRPITVRICPVLCIASAENYIGMNAGLAQDFTGFEIMKA